jgi:MFS family permease
MNPAARGLAPPASRVLWLIPAVYFLFVTGEFLALTTLVLTITDQGASGLRVGVLASALWLGILGTSMVAHRVVARFGHARVFVAGSVVATLALSCLPWTAAYTVWLAAAAVLGMAGGLVWVAGESWLAEAAPAARRGFYVGLFETSVGLALMTGPALLPLALALGLPPLWLAVLLLAAGTACSALLLAEVPLGAADTVPPASDPPPLPPAATSPAGVAARSTADATPIWRVVWPLVAVAAASGVLESGISSMLPSISMRLGFEMQLAAWLGVVIGAGSALLQPPFGALADRIGMPRTMALAWALVLATLGWLWLVAAAPQGSLWAVGFVLGGVGGAVYTLVVIELGHRFTGSRLVPAMGALVTGYTLGTAGAPMAGGWLFDHFGLAGLSAALWCVAAAGAFVAWRALRPARRN